MRYAVKIGEIFAVSEKPIGDEERRQIAEYLEQGFVQEMIVDNLIEIRVVGEQ